MNPQNLFFIVLISLVASCGPSPIPESYRVQFPRLPSLHTELLGDCCWRLEYYDSNGNFCRSEVSKNGIANVKISVSQEWPNAVIAWPYWPEKALTAGLLCPAGALFPLDISGDSIILSWEAGAEAYFYRELEKAQEFNTGTNRVPAFFDWKRFRSLLRESTDEELRLDPWLADWKDIAERTIRSGFRQSYVRAESRTNVDIKIPHDGPWLAASPFKRPEYWEKDEGVSLRLSPRPEIFICSGGRLNVSEYTWIWIPF